MKLFRAARWVLVALVLSLVPASSFAGVFISVGFAPPVMPVYEQPPCPEPGWMWTPGYWGYGPDGYYWVPGTWVPAPYEGALWTPGYWGWGDGLYVWHAGYWGPHVGYYGGVNYGFGYMGIGFVGGLWRGHDFVYNTAVVHVNERFIHNTYVDRTIVDRYTVRNDQHVAFSGGPGGINHAPSAEERVAMHEQHVGATSFQSQHMNAAMNDRGSYFKANGGHPQSMAVEQPNSFNGNREGGSQYGGQNRQQFQNQPQGQQPHNDYRQPQQNQQRYQGQPQGQQPRNDHQPPAQQGQQRYQGQPQGQQPRNDHQPPAQQHEQAHPQQQHEDHKGK